MSKDLRQPQPAAQGAPSGSQEATVDPKLPCPRSGHREGDRRRGQDQGVPRAGKERLVKRRRKTVREQAEAMISRHGANAERYAHYKADDAAKESTVLYWEAVEREIRAMRLRPAS